MNTTLNLLDLQDLHEDHKELLILKGISATAEVNAEVTAIANAPKEWRASNEERLQRGLNSRFVKKHFAAQPEALAMIATPEAFASTLAAVATTNPEAFAAAFEGAIAGLSPETVERIFVFIEHILPLLEIAGMIYTPILAVAAALKFIDARYRKTHPKP